MAVMRRLPSLTQLRHLVAVAEVGHFGRAAEACFITQSSLSASIKELETALGRVLIERTRRRVMVTPLGDAVVARARGLLRGAEDIVDLVQAAGAPLTGPLRLGVIPTIGPFLLPRVLPAIRGVHPSLKIYLREDTSAKLIEGLKKGDLDLALLAFPYDVDGLESYVFADDPFWVAFTKDAGYGAKERLTYADLGADEMILLEEGHCLRDHALGIGGKRRPQAADFGATSMMTLVQMVDNGLGVTLLPKMAVDAGLTRGTGVQVRPLEGARAQRRIGFCWRPSSPRKEEYRLFSDFFRDELATPLSPKQKR